MEAANGDKKQKSSEENVRTSLFHRRLAQRTLLDPQEEMKFLLHRMVVICRISPELADKRDLGGFYIQSYPDYGLIENQISHYERLSQHLQRRYQLDAFTGLLLLYPSHAVHIVESSSDVLVSVLRDLRDMQGSPRSALIVEARVLVVSHDLSSRLFREWSYKVLDLPATTLTDRNRNREPTEKMAAGALKQILKLGSHLLKGSKDLSVSPESVLDQMPELIVPQDVLAQLLEREELLTPQQYLQAYHSPFNKHINSGHTFGSVCSNTV